MASVLLLILLILLWTNGEARQSSGVFNLNALAEDGDQKKLFSIERLPLVQQVSLCRRRKDQRRFGAGHICGGTLITHNVVLTAAHCFVDRTKYDGSFLAKREFTVLLGVRRHFESGEDTVSREPDKLLMQLTQFDLRTYDKDIALIILRGTVPPFIPPIPVLDTYVQLPTSCQIGGWNSTAVEYFTGQLLSYGVDLIDVASCRAGRLGQRSLLPGMLCARSAKAKELPGMSACTAESGGSLLCGGRLVGIGSWGIQCGMPGLVGVYTDVAYYREWILDSIQEHSWTGKAALRSSNADDEHHVDSQQLIKSSGESSLVQFIHHKLAIVIVFVLCL